MEVIPLSPHRGREIRDYVGGSWWARGRATRGKEQRFIPKSDDCKTKSLAISNATESSICQSLPQTQEPRLCRWH